MSATAATDSLRADHRRIETHLDRLLAALQHLAANKIGEVRREFQNIRRLARPHFEQEDNVFYPQLREADAALLARMDAEHEHTRLVEQYLEDLLASLPEDPDERELGELYRLGIEFHDAVQTHIVDEEDYLLALADRVLSAQEQQLLLARMQEHAEAISGTHR
ncbi:MAG TPA: hemerythrin domain-containing protein [Bryobacterales bacterium]|nr:hemerythrin domain-containing protein [Bryobacterales bacterium]